MGETNTKTHFEVSMKQEKRPFKERFLEAIGESVLSLILFGMGALVLCLFGFGIDSLDGDAISLIGIGVIVVLGLIISLAEWIKKRIKRK